MHSELERTHLEAS